MFLARVPQIFDCMDACRCHNDMEKENFSCATFTARPHEIGLFGTKERGHICMYTRTFPRYVRVYSICLIFEDRNDMYH